LEQLETLHKPDTEKQFNDRILKATLGGAETGTTNTNGMVDDSIDLSFSLN
jgi:hypothetical protein